MIKRFLPLLSLAVLLPFSHALAADATTALYAKSVSDISYANAYEPEKALGAPDQSMMSFLGKDAYVTLDLGQDVKSTDTPTIYMELIEAGANARLEFLDDAKNIVGYGNAVFSIGDTTRTIINDGTANYRYLRITSAEEAKWKLDAIKVSTVTETTPSTSTTETTTTTDTTPPDATTNTQGMLIKLVDDGDVSTQTDAAVYVIGTDGMRHAFPNQTVFYSWFENFNDVAYVTPEIMASYPLGKNVTIRPGTFLVKIVSDPTVYAVTPYGYLQQIPSETQAKKLYGDKWNERVVDIDDTLFGNYRVNDYSNSEEPLEKSVVPIGSLLISPIGEVLYLDSVTIFRHLPGSVTAQMGFTNDSFSPINVDKETLALYEDGGDFEFNADLRWPY